MANLGGTHPGPAFGGGYPASIWGLFAAAAFQDEPGKFPATAWPIAPQQPIQFLPWKSKFKYTPPKTNKKHGGATSTQGGTGTSGGGTSTPPPPPPTTTNPPTSTNPPTT
jgi:hypothetical protein